MANTTNFNWETPDDTDLVKDGAAAMRTLGNSIDTSFVDLKGGTTGQVLSKASNTDLDYTWVTTDDANAIQNAIVDAKGDIIAATANDTPARLAVGANNTVLTADSSTATGLKWAAPASTGTVGCALFAQALAFAYTQNTEVVIPFASETFDTDSFHSTSSNTSRITIPTGKGGNYRISGEFFLTGVGSNYAILKIFKNGAQITAEGIFQGQFVRYASGGNTAVLNGSVILPLVAGDYLELFYVADSATGTHTSYAQFNAILLP